MHSLIFEMLDIILFFRTSCFEGECNNTNNQTLSIEERLIHMSMQRSTTSNDHCSCTSRFVPVVGQTFQTYDVVI